MPSCSCPGMASLPQDLRDSKSTQAKDYTSSSSTDNHQHYTTVATNNDCYAVRRLRSHRNSVHICVYLWHCHSWHLRYTKIRICFVSSHVVLQLLASRCFSRSNRLQFSRPEASSTPTVDTWGFCKYQKTYSTYSMAWLMNTSIQTS